MEMELILFLGVTVWGILGFFLTKFYNSVEQIKAGITKILVSMAKNDEAIIMIEKEIHEIRLHIDKNEKRLRDIEIKIAKL